MISVIGGFGVFGEKEDKLEIMDISLYTDKDTDVIGYLTAEEVFNRINFYETRRDLKMEKIVVDENTLELKTTVVENDTEDVLNLFKNALGCDSEEFGKKYRKYKKAEAEFSALFEPFKANLLKLYKEHEGLPKTVIAGGVKCTYVSSSTRSTIDTKKLKEEKPMIAKKYTKITNVSPTIKLENPTT